MKTKIKILFKVFLIALTFIFGSQSFFAQPSLNFRDVIVNWPEITCQVSVSCADTPIKYLITKNFQIIENGNEIGELTGRYRDSTHSIYELKYLAGCCIVDRFVQITVRNITDCKGTDTKMKKYLRPKPDTSTYQPITFRLGSDIVKGSEIAEIPLMLETPINDILPIITVKIFFDETCCQFLGFDTREYLLAGVPFYYEWIDGGIEFTTVQPKMIHGAGILAMARFKASDLENDTKCPLRLFGMRFTGGCFHPVLVPGELIILARRPNVSTVTNVPRELQIDKKSKEYFPNPITIEISATNSGDRKAKNGIAVISFEKNDFHLLSPTSTRQALSPTTINTNDVSVARWNLYAYPRLKGDSVKLCVTSIFENVPDPLSTECKIWIPKSPLTGVHADQIILRSFVLEQNYPNPFSTSTTINLSPTLSLNKERENIGKHRVNLKVFDVFGREVLDLTNAIDNPLSADKLTIDNSQLPTTGIYFYRLTIGYQSQTKMMMFLK